MKGGLLLTEATLPKIVLLMYYVIAVILGCKGKKGTQRETVCVCVLFWVRFIFLYTVM